MLPVRPGFRDSSVLMRAQELSLGFTHTGRRYRIGVAECLPPMSPSWLAARVPALTCKCRSTVDRGEVLASTKSWRVATETERSTLTPD